MRARESTPTSVGALHFRTTAADRASSTIKSVISHPILSMPYKWRNRCGGRNQCETDVSLQKALATSIPE
jgi:hypothetical protein